MNRSLNLVLDLSFAGFAAVVDGADNDLATDWRSPGARYDDVGDWIEGLLRQAGGAFSELDSIAVGVGPGSFTGIRIAMAFAQGLALPRNLPLYGFNSFAPLLLSCESKLGDRHIAVIPSNAGRFYASSDLHETGVMAGTEELLRLANPETTLIIPARVTQVEALLTGFSDVHIIEGKVNATRLAKHARESNFDALRPHYLQLSAAETKIT